jgi:hypothetical protein
MDYTTNRAFQCGDCGTLVVRGRFADEDDPTSPEK